MIVDFSRHMGVAFQILNDLKDWEPDSDNKLVAGQDVLAAPVERVEAAACRFPVAAFARA